MTRKTGTSWSSWTFILCLFKNVAKSNTRCTVTVTFISYSLLSHVLTSRSMFHILLTEFSPIRLVTLLALLDDSSELLPCCDYMITSHIIRYLI